MTDNNERCTVLYVPTTKRKIEEPGGKARKRELPYDESTYAGRLNLAIRAMRLQRGDFYGQNDLLADIQRSVGRTMNDRLLVSQQTLSKLQHGKQKECANTPAIATALAVSSMWLAYRVGPASLIDEVRLKIISRK